MGKAFYALVIAGIVLFVGLVIFPSFNPLLNSVDTTGFSELLVGAVTFFPYIAIFFIGYAVYLALNGGGNKP